MDTFDSLVDVQSGEYARNRTEMLGLVDRLHRLRDRPRRLSERRREVFQKRGQLLPRERIARLLDPGLPFLELFGLANYLVDDPDRDKSIPGASTLAGIGFVSGVRCMIYAYDSGINAGASTAKSGEKLRRCLDMARLLKLPFLQLVESAGANLMKYNVAAWAWGGGGFRRLAQLSAAGVPVLTILHGPSTAGGAYYPGLSDYVIAVRGRGRASLGGAALVRAATGEIADEEELAGAVMHAEVSGLVEYLADDDAHAITLLRGLVEQLDWNRHCAPEQPAGDYRPPRYSPDELAGVVPIDYRKAYDVREVLVRLTDDSCFSEFKSRYGPTVVCTHARIMGRACGIVGNNGPIDPNGAAKAAQFLQSCDQAQLPVIFLNNITGYMVGREYEQGGMVKHGSKMIQAVANIRVPKITLYIGASFGAGNYGMAGLGYDPDFLFAWPNARTGVMGGEQAALTMEQVTRQAAARRGQAVDEQLLAKQKADLIAHYEAQEDAFYTSGQMLDMGVIDPRDSRRVLGFALETCAEARRRTVQANSFGVARM
ncbi:MAG: carboxyl transferase domain-containing protein [Burkholderiaceae bacterium]